MCNYERAVMLKARVYEERVAVRVAARVAAMVAARVAARMAGDL